LKKVKNTLKLKNKHYKILFFAFVFVFLKSNAQNNLTKLKGIVKHDSTYLQDINIINKTTNFGATSSITGSFTLYVKKGDSILFSSLVYIDRIILISETHLKTKSITVYLEPDYYQLDEVMLDKKILLNSIKIAVAKGTILDNDKMSNKKLPNARKLTDPNANAGGINPIAIFMLITKKLTEKSRLRKKG